MNTPTPSPLVGAILLCAFYVFPVFLGLSFRCLRWHLGGSTPLSACLPLPVSFPYFLTRFSNPPDKLWHWNPVPRSASEASQTVAAALRSRDDSRRRTHHCL